MLTVIYWELIQASTCLIAALSGSPNGLQLAKCILTLWIIVAHHSLDRSLLIESRNLRNGRFTILGPMSINRILSGPLLSLGILSALSILLVWSDFDGIGPSIDLLFGFVLFVGSTDILSDNERILVKSRIGSHSKTVSSLAGCQFPIVIVLIVDVAQG